MNMTVSSFRTNYIRCTTRTVASYISEFLTFDNVIE